MLFRSRTTLHLNTAVGVASHVPAVSHNRPQQLEADEQAVFRNSKARIFEVTQILDHKDPCADPAASDVSRFLVYFLLGRSVESFIGFCNIDVYKEIDRYLGKDWAGSYSTSHTAAFTRVLHNLRADPSQ